MLAVAVNGYLAILADLCRSPQTFDHLETASAYARICISMCAAAPPSSRQCRASPRAGAAETRPGSGTRGHVGGQDAAIWTSRKSTPASSMVVTKLWRSMYGCGLVIRTPAASVSRRRRRVAAWRFIRAPRLLSRMGPRVQAPVARPTAGRRLVAAGPERPWCLCRARAGPGGRVLRRGR